MTNLQIYPQTALLFLMDALRSTTNHYRLELFVSPGSLGACLWVVDPDTQESKLLLQEPELQVLLSKFVTLLQTEGQEPQPGPGLSDSTGVP